MTLRADLAALVAEAGLPDADVEGAVADEHVRWRLYVDVIEAVTAAPRRGGDRAIAAAILRDPEELVSKAAVVRLVDNVAAGAAGPAEFQRWAAELAPEIRRFAAEGHRAFVHRRIRDWTVRLAIESGRTPDAAELADTTPWMQRVLAEESTSSPVLAVLAESGRTRKIRNIARDRARKLAKPR